MPRNWLNIFTAVRNANEFEAQQDQRAIENKRADEQLGWARDAEQRTATDWNSERMREVSTAALTAYNEAARNMQDPEQRAAAFDRIIPALQASGFDTQRIGAIRQQVIENPDFASQIVRGIRAGSGQQQTYAPRAVIDRTTGRARYAAPGDEVGEEPADAYLSMGRLDQGDRRLDLGEANLEHRVAIDDPAYQEDRAYAQQGGRERAEVAITLPRLDEITDTAISRVGRLLQNPALDSIFGLPNVSRLDTGGFGAAGVVPGTPAADALNQLNQTIGDVQTAAYESLRGGGQITEAERESISRGLVALDRATSPQEATRALRELSGVLDRRRLAAHRAAETPLTGGRTQAPAPRTQQTPAPAEAPAQGGIRQPGESADQLLGRLGL